VAGATMNAMEHGNHYRPETLVAVRVLASAGNFCVRSTDRGVGPIPAPGAEAQALKDRLEGRESLRDWGLSLIRNMVDEVNETICEDHLRADPAPERRRPCQRIGLTSVRHRSGAAVIDLYGVIDGFAEEALAAYDEA
jgi:hypothetical protein